jgi:hypothetical protein
MALILVVIALVAFFRRAAPLALVLGLTGCATIENGADHVRDFAVRHPVVTAVGTAVVIGGAVAALDHHGHHAPTAQCKPAGSIWGTTLEEIQTGCAQ